MWGITVRCLLKNGQCVNGCGFGGVNFVSAAHLEK